MNTRLMDNLRILSTHTTPEVTYDPENGQLTFKGNSYQSNIEHFYTYLFKWLDNFVPPESLTIDFYLNLINSSSLKYLYKVMALVDNKSQAHQSRIHINWHYQSYDADLLEIGQDLSKSFQKFTFEFVDLEDDKPFLIHRQ